MKLNTLHCSDIISVGYKEKISKKKKKIKRKERK
jgi:hypothetical protein